MGQFTADILLTFPESVNEALRLVVERLFPQKIILFGSRARGDNRPNSDFDFCLVRANLDSQIRSELRLALEEEPISLYKMDILFFEELSEDYLRNINKEGKVIYG